MKPPAIRRFQFATQLRRRERGITMLLVALAMIAIIAMAALSIDVITLYLAREEAQRSADAAALAAARVISISGMTGDPNNAASSRQAICGPGGSATQAATAVATQSAVGGGVVSSPTVTYSAGGNSGADCSALGAAFGVNPMVTVQITRASLPTFFSRIWGNTGNTVSATATAEAFNPSNSGNVGNGVSGNIIPVQPRCVKPWIVPNRDPLNPGPNGGVYCDQTSGGSPGACQTLVRTSDGSIRSPGISLNGGAVSTGIIGERFWLVADCHHSGSTCRLRGGGASPQIQANLPKNGSPYIEDPPSLDYVPGQTLNSSVAVPACSLGTSLYQRAVAGCDQTTQYQCGVQKSNEIDLRENPAGSDDTSDGVQCLINQGNTGGSQPSGQDSLNPYGRPSAYPFQILVGHSNPLVGAGLASGTPITSSSSIVTLPIYDETAGSINLVTTQITIVGFLQAFINEADQWGNVNVTVLNVAGCSNGGGPDPVSSSPVTGSSPVPIRLITPP